MKDLPNDFGVKEKKLEELRDETKFGDISTVSSVSVMQQWV